MGEAVFFTYIGAATTVAALALLFGSSQKAYGAATLLGTLIVCNILFRLRVLGHMPLEGMLWAFASMDLCAAVIFARFYSPKALQRNRWAAFAAGAQLCMFLAELCVIFIGRLRSSPDLFIALNVISVAVITACLVAFTPKDWQEAKQVLAIKLFYIRNDIFRLRLRMNRKSEPNRVDAHIGEKMRLARILKGMTREELGTALGVSGQQVERYEKAMNRISASTLHDAAKALGVEVSYFFEGIDEVKAGTVLAFPSMGKLHGKS